MSLEIQLILIVAKIVAAVAIVHAGTWLWRRQVPLGPRRKAAAILTTLALVVPLVFAVMLGPRINREMDPRAWANGTLKALLVVMAAAALVSALLPVLMRVPGIRRWLATTSPGR
jgi:hypothetical protein